MNKLLKELDGQEIWTDAFEKRFDERVCVGIENGECIHDGEAFKPTKEEIKNLWDDYIIQEFGSKEQMIKNLEEEFGGRTL